jgi:hypothetical protein
MVPLFKDSTQKTRISVRVFTFLWYNNHMKFRYGVWIAAVVFLPVVVMANGLITHDATIPYEIVPIEDITKEQYAVGELNNYPEMYEFTIDIETAVSVAVRYPLTSTVRDVEVTPQLGLIVVKVVEPRGVAEVARVASTDATWEIVRDPLSKLLYEQGGTFTKTLEPGTYRVEVSTPDNQSPYILAFSGQHALTFGEKFSLVGDLYEFYGVSKVGMIRSPLIVYPIGIVVLLGLIVLTWWYSSRR